MSVIKNFSDFKSIKYKTFSIKNNQAALKRERPISSKQQYKLVHKKLF